MTFEVVQQAADLGVEVRAFDYTAADPAALAGVTTLVLISSNDFNDRAGQHRDVDVALDRVRHAGGDQAVRPGVAERVHIPLGEPQPALAVHRGEVHLVGFTGGQYDMGVLADLAVNEPDAFATIVGKAKDALAA